jgi:hypothetical protein
MSETTTKRFRVEWATGVDAVDGWEAALQGWQQLRQPGVAPKLVVRERDGKHVATLSVQEVLDHLYLGRKVRARGLPGGHGVKGAASAQAPQLEGEVVAVVPTCQHCHLFCIVPSWGAHAPAAGPCISLFEEKADRTLVLK